MPCSPTTSTSPRAADAAAVWEARARAAADRTLPHRGDDLVPPPRFGATSFAAYRIVHPSGAAARDRVRAAALRAGATPPPRRSWLRPWRRAPRARGEGLFLDGGFGVGKTHLLAAAWHAAPLTASTKRYLSFQDLVHRIGVLGRAGARDAFADTRLLCLDEFELDDPGNTLVIANFLGDLFARDATVLTTSNTPPDRQGEGRFAADDFRREILGIAERFETVRIDGPDQRATGTTPRWSDRAALDAALASGPEPVALVTGAALMRTLASLHPVRYARLLADTGTLVVRELRPVSGANDALRFVHFIDKAYELGVRFRADGVAAPSELFDATLASGPWGKKIDRCRSRLAEMLHEPLHPD